MWIHRPSRRLQRRTHVRGWRTKIALLNLVESLNHEGGRTLSCRWNEESRPANIAQPIRTILRKHSNTQVLMDEVAELKKS
jgi:hypothetical protein